MGHDEHFLSRLDRVELRQTEFALSLYNDAPLVQYVLDHSKLPERAERVAISLDDPVRGPFIIVTREGKFVTCLGVGMSPRPHPIITRAELDAVLSNAHAMRERTVLAMQALRRHGHVSNIEERLYTAGEFMSREEMAALAVWQPILWNLLWDLFLRSAMDVGEIAMDLLPVSRPEAQRDPQYRHLWHSFWCCAHTLTLLTHTGTEDFQQMLAGLRDQNTSIVELLMSFVVTGAQGFALRGMWCSVQLHRHSLPPHQKRFRESPYLHQIDDAVLGLTGCGAAHPEHLAEIVPTIFLPEPEAPTSPDDGKDPVAGYRAIVGRRGVAALVTPDDVLWSRMRAVGGAAYVKMVKNFPREHPQRWTKPEEVPDELAVTALLHSRVSYHASYEDLAATLDAVPIVARLPMEKLYFPREVTDGFVHKWDPTPVLELLALRRATEKQRAPEPRRAPRVPGRNEPCVCGSGKKYKKCCGG